MSVRILIADSDEFLMAAYREHLSHHGAVVSTATTGLACIDRLREFTPDVLVLDPAILWGGGDGVLAVMHEELTIRPPFVLLLTRGADRSLLYRLSSFRVDDYQAKPLSPTRLTERICMLRRSINMGAIPDREVAPRRSPALAIKL
jgi:DNA-binding response OmpR family regulator